MNEEVRPNKKIDHEKIMSAIKEIGEQTEPATISEYRKNLKKELNKRIASIQVFQEQPNTCVVLDIDVFNEGELERFVGFSKVSYPDTFDSQYGIEMARNKAIGKAVKSHMMRFYGYYIHECMTAAFDLVHKILGNVEKEIEKRDKEQEDGADEPAGADQT